MLFRSYSHRVSAQTPIFIFKGMTNRGKANERESCLQNAKQILKFLKTKFVFQPNLSLNEPKILLYTIDLTSLLNAAIAKMI